MRCSPSALAATLAALGLSAWAQVGDGPLAPMTAPPSIYSSAPPSIAVTRPAAAVRPQIGATPAVVPGQLTAEAREERMFLRNVAAQSRFELEASRLAFAKSANAPVRTLAASLINHHNTVGLEVAHLLHSRGMAMPMMSNEQSRVLRQLNKLGGGKFDALYMQHVGLQQAAVARDYEKAGAAIREPQLHAWIVRQVANTRYHQHIVERSAAAASQLAASKSAGKPQAKAPLQNVQPVATNRVGRVNASSTQ